MIQKGQEDAHIVFGGIALVALIFAWVATFVSGLVGYWPGVAAGALCQFAPIFVLWWVTQ
jgi:hypothetical protein